jgi:hypothetical protein
MKIKRGRNRRGDPPAWRELLGWIDDSHSDQRTANTLLNICLSNQFLFDLFCVLERSEIVRRPDCVAGGFKP